MNTKACYRLESNEYVILRRDDSLVTVVPVIELTDELMDRLSMKSTMELIDDLL
jgi:hypothetical protein